jgi:hypothetical protein
MTTLAAVAAVRSGMADGCGTAQHGHRHRENGKKSSHRNAPLPKPSSTKASSTNAATRNEPWCNAVSPAPAKSREIFSERFVRLPVKDSPY